MALYAIGDLHLCLGAPKPMDIFGGAWVGYMDQAQRRPVRHPAGGYHGSAGGFELGVGLVRREGGFCVDQRHSRTKDHSKGKSRLLVEHGGEIPEVSVRKTALKT